MRIFFASIFYFISIVVFSQNNLASGELLQINNRIVNTKEFINVFTKNASLINEEDQLSIEEYFELFKTYHLKLEEAYDLGLHKDSIFLKEYQKYYKQLADNYIANGDVTEKLIKETYYRTVNEVKASHILISPTTKEGKEDWEEAFNTAWDVKEKLDNGEDFNSLASLYSSDPSVSNNAGNLGWFKAFKMVTPFENAVYNLELNEISEPIQTQFGYHIIKKTGERESIGKIKVAHIMVNLQQKDTAQTPEEKINSIYQKVLAGEDFQSLAKQFSQDQNTAQKGGEMNAFGIGDLNSTIFSDEAFSLTEDGEISKPFKTRFGWHIVKRLETIPPSPYEEVKEDLRRRIKTSDRAKLLNERIQEKIESYYDVNTDEAAIAFLSTIVTKDAFKGKWKLLENENIPNKKFLTINNVSYSWKELAQYIEKNQRAAKEGNSIENLVSELANNYVYANLIEFHKQNLPKLEPEFAETINEYKNGLLLFEVMQREVWDFAKEDTIGLKDYYSKNKVKYKSEEKIETEMISFSQKKQAKKFVKKLKNNASFSATAKSTSEGLFQEAEIYVTNSPAISNQLDFKEGVSKIVKHNNQYLIYNVIEFIPTRQLEFDEIKGKVLADYQDYLEENWIKKLSEKYGITINENELIKLKLEFEE